jgi:hypothetical protein
VILAAYCSGDGLDRVVASLDAQWLPQDEFETAPESFLFSHDRDTDWLRA